jgi:Zn-finger nucleic acid-binding protein
MQCPKCETPFQAITYENIEIDRCPECGGIWFDAQEMRELQRVKDARRIDVGDKSAGPNNDESRDIRCPRCQALMLTVIDSVQRHITFESCPECLGTFLDAGEFRDLSQLTMTERARKLIDTWLAVR